MDITDEERHALETAARDASLNAYCPYSHFPVGAAVLTTGGAVFAGCNVENASFGLTICAERNAIFQAVAQAERSIRALLVYTPTPTPTMPCGACRQVIQEFGPDAEILSICDGEESAHVRQGDLLPHGFGAHDLAPREAPAPAAGPAGESSGDEVYDVVVD